MKTEQHILMVGNAIDGYEVYGPFESAEDAAWYGDTHIRNVDWLVTELTQVNMECGDPDYDIGPTPSELAAGDKDR